MREVEAAEDGARGLGVGEEGEDAHFRSAVGASEGEDLVDAGEEACPAGGGGVAGEARGGVLLEVRGWLVTRSSGRAIYGFGRVGVVAAEVDDIGRASAKWAIMAPIFVPMLMLMDFSPELTQAAYRIGDSFTNVLTPLLPYFPLVIIFAQKYVPDIGIGTLISVMLPFSVTFAIVGIITLIVWVLFGIPIGPDAPLYYGPAGLVPGGGP